MENSNDAQIVLVMNTIDAINLRKERSIPADCEIIECDSEFLDFTNPLVVQLKKDDLLHDKNVLIKSPYSSAYYCYEEASEKIHSDYFRQFCTILGALGATEVSVSECSTEDSSSLLKASIKFFANVFKGNISGEKKVSKHQEALLSLKRTFDPYLNLEKAKELMSDFSLQNDEQLQELIKALEGGLKETSREFNLTLSKKLKSTFAAAAKITPYTGINFDVNMHNEKETFETYSLHIKVKFDSSLMG